jgi:hypothetical protein
MSSQSEAMKIGWHQGRDVERCRNFKKQEVDNRPNTVEISMQTEEKSLDLKMYLLLLRPQDPKECNL